MTATLTPAAPAPVVALVPGFEARLAAAEAVMTVRLEQAGMRHAVDSMLPETVVDLADVVTAPAPAAPVAALLHRARARILRDGWCRDAASDGASGMCLTEALRVEARSHADEGEARILLRHALGGGDSIPEMNRRLPDATAAITVLDRAAAMATERGL